MLIHAKNTIGMNIIEMTELKKIATVKNIIVDPENGAILGFLLEKPHFFAKPKVVSVKDIVEFYADGILVRDQEAIVDIGEILKIKDVLQKKIFLLKSKVFTQKGQYLGMLDDFIFDTNLNFLVTIVAKKIFPKEKRIMSADRILSILPKRVIIRDIIEKVEIGREWGKIRKAKGLAAAIK